MNHIYKVIWSRTKHQYVVASELARSVTHAAGGHMGRAAAAILAAIILTAGAGMGEIAQAETSNLTVKGSAGVTWTAHAELTTESVQTVLDGQTLNLGGLTINNSSVLTEAAMDGYVKWEKDDQGQTTDKINGVELKDGAIKADAVKTTHGADLDDVYKRTQGIKGNAYMTNIRDMLFVNSAGASIPGLNGETAIQMGKDGIITVSNDVKTADGVSLVGLNKTVEENAKGVVKWDPDGKGGYQEGTLKGVQFTGDGNLTVADFTASSDAEVKGALTVQGKTTINADVDVKGNGKFDGKVTAGKDATFAAGSDDLVTAGQLYEAGIIPGKVEAKQGTTITEGESMALGKDSLVNANNSIAIGPDAKATNANATAVGPQSWASGNHSSAFGVQSHASAEGSLALGYNTNAQAKNSVALGAGSIANEADTISVGRYSKDSPQYNFTRRITNVSDGVKDTDAATVGQMNKATEGMVQWDDENKNTIHGVGLDEGGHISGSSLNVNSALGNVKIEYGAITTNGNAQSTIGGVTFQDGKVGADFIQVGDSSKPNETTRIDGGSVSTGTAYVHDKLIAANAYIGTEAEGNAVVTKDQLTTSVGDATEDMVKWDNSDHNTIKGVGFDGDGALSAGNGGFTVDEIGQLHAQAGDLEGAGYLNVTEDGLKMGTTGGPSMNFTSNGVEFAAANGSTYINGNEINTGTVLAQGMYVGSKADENKVATMGDLSAEVSGATEGVVKWDKVGDTYQEGYLTAEHQLSAGNGNLLVDEEGVHLKTADEKLGDSEDTTSYYLDMTNENGISMGYTGGSSMTITSQGVTISDVLGKETHITGSEISTGTVHADLVQADDMYRGDATNPDNQVVTKGELDTAVAAGTENAVKYDENGELHAGHEGTGKLDLDKENGAASLTSGNGEHSLSVTNNGTSVTGGMAVEGGMLVSGGLTVDGSVQIANEDGSFSSLATSEDVNKVQEAVNQNAADISGIKTEIGVNEDGTYKTIDNGATDVITGINNNTASIGTINSQIGATGENGALNLSNGATTIEGGINANTTMIQQQGQAINALDDRVSDLGDEIDSVGAISSALAGLHPLDYDGTGSKFQLSAAVGSYDSTQAAAIGGFYHFNEDVMLSVGGATSFNGDHKTAGNIGVTFRVGPGGEKKAAAASEDVMAQIEAMNAKMQAMEEKIAALEAENKSLSEAAPAEEAAEAPADAASETAD